MLMPTLDLLKIAYGRFIIGAYNVQNMEQVLAVFRGSLAAQAPVIVATVPFARDYAGAQMLQAMVRAADEMYPGAVAALHLDHGDEAHCLDAIRSGAYHSVMIDASHMPFEENIRVTRRIVERAHAAGLAVEAELGVVTGQEARHSGDAHAALTDPDQAAEFVARTGCDSLAVAIGTSHGAYKFQGEQRLHFDRLAEIQSRLPQNFPLVLHGASSVPADDVARINAAGGRLNPNARGVDPADFARAWPLGVAKINIHTDAHLLWYRVHREHFRDHPENFDFRHPGSIFMQAFEQLIVTRSKQLGCAGQLDEVRVQRYAAA
ncbi:MAG: class II fructose-bisphosphate aldolase family protein [Anaerolineae bacterium]|nr:class II fructose-bisphosphate aldolase family protein [Anaerolineae bacterium]MDW8070968.1 class II fructose-bisphosphate aldolase [Anaerolineae bacterium]